LNGRDVKKQAQTVESSTYAIIDVEGIGVHSIEMDLG
jgi:hypothetical protein